VTNQKDGREIVLDMLIELNKDDEFSHRVLGRTLRRYQDKPKQERAFISRLFTGTVKHYLTLDYCIEQFSSLPVRKMKPLIGNILRLSAYQLIFMDNIPASAVCNEAVKLAKKRGFKRLSGFVNANVRNIARMGKDIKYPDKELETKVFLSIRYSTPKWLVNMLLDQYNTTQVEMMLEASLKEKEITIRCNRMKTTPDELKEILYGEGVRVIDHPYLEEAFIIKDFDYLESLRSFTNGLFAIQDVSSMLVGKVANVCDKDFVVDVCAAPGGKTLHLAERAGRVSARDLTEYKVKLIKDNILRLGAGNVETKVWDARVKEPGLLNKADIVIADLPCSGLGVLGKKSDIKYRLTQEQLKDLVELQREILDVVSAYVKPGGILIYSTCTINRHENIDNMEWFLDKYDFVAEGLDDYLPEALQGDTTKAGYLQLLQGIHPTDGFFICRMRKGKKVEAWT
jgi:16S rRNA (cytosine967-C5)-methyltransferase